MSFSQFGRERRQTPRIDWDSLSWMLTLEFPQLPSQNLRIEPKDISLGGLKLFSNTSFPLQTKLNILLIQPQNKQQMRLEGEIHRLEEIQQADKENIYGLAIRWLNPTEITALQNWLKPHLPYSSSFRSR